MKRQLLPARRTPTSHHVNAEGVLAPIGPEAVEVHARCLAIGAHLAATLVVTGYPAEVTPGWLSPLLNYPGRLDVALHIEPVPTAAAAAGLKKQRARLEATRRSGWDKGRLDDPEAEAAATDAADLAYRIARGEGKLFRVGLYLTIHAPDEASLTEEVSAVRAVAESLLITTSPTTYRALPAWLATLPLGIDTMKIRRTFDTTALAACFPFTSPDLPTPTTGTPSGVLYGLNTASGAPVFWDRFAQDNYNSITLARSGAGKSYLTKLELLRLMTTGVHACVIDPEDEYVRLAETVGGHIVRPGAEGVCLNAFDLPDHTHSSEDALTRRILFLHTFIAVLTGTSLQAAHTAVLDRALLATYARAGITADPRTWTRTPPQLGDLAMVLADDNDPAAIELAHALAPYVTGSHAATFNGPNTTATTGHLLVFALRQLPEEIKAPAMLLALDTIWRQVTGDDGARRKRLVVVDEAWLLMRDGAGARFLARLAKSARKYWTGLAVVTQDADDVLSSGLGQAVVANAATQILLRQAPQAIDQITQSFHLSRGERDFLLTAGQGEALLLAGDRHKVGFISVAAPGEHEVITTNPAELALHNLDEPLSDEHWRQRQEYGDDAWDLP